MAAVEVPGAVLPVDAALVTPGSPSMNMLLLPEREKEAIRGEVAEGRLRVGALFLWDTLDQDADAVRVSGAGYGQEIVITHERKMIYVPYVPGSSVTITPIRDGGGGGVTLGVSTTLGPVPLPHLVVGQSLEIPVL
jgi:hypothetical protein